MSDRPVPPPHRSAACFILEAVGGVIYTPQERIDIPWRMEYTEENLVLLKRSKVPGYYRREHGDFLSN
jgi:hypothetical protein